MFLLFIVLLTENHIGFILELRNQLKPHKPQSSSDCTIISLHDVNEAFAYLTSNCDQQVVLGLYDKLLYCRCIHSMGLAHGIRDILQYM